MTPPPQRAEFRRSSTPIHGDAGMTVLKSSEGLGWTALYAEITSETPHEMQYHGTQDIWLAMAMQPAGLWRRTGLHDHQGLMLPDSMVVTAAGEVSSARVQDQARVMHVFVRAPIFDAVARELSAASGVRRPAVASAFGIRDRGLSLMLRSLKQSLDDSSDIAGMKADCLARAIAAHALGYGADCPSRRAAALDARRLRTVVDYLHDNLAGSLRLDEMATVAGMGRTAFVQQFKGSTGQSPHQYVMAMRVRKACDLLEHSRLTLSDIAHACGFSDQAHMSTCFRRAVGVTPSQYRRDRG